jgi:hypothetical protein
MAARDRGYPCHAADVRHTLLVAGRHPRARSRGSAATLTEPGVAALEGGGEVPPPPARAGAYVDGPSRSTALSADPLSQVTSERRPGRQAGEPSVSPGIQEGACFQVDPAPNRWSSIRTQTPMRPPETEATTRTWGRLASALAYLLVAGQLAGTAHFLTVRHGICPFDGELIDLVGVEHHHAHARPRNERSPIADANDGHDGHHGHEHCILAASRRERAIYPGGVEFRSPPRAFVATLPVGETSPGARIALHRLAPKQSPPA